MNTAILMGRLVRDPEMRTTQAGKHVTTFTIAVDRPGQKKETDFIPCVAWDKTADFVSNYFSKGKQILINGRIQVRKYDKDGENRYATEIIVNNVEFVGAKNDNGNGGGDTSGGTGSFGQTGFGNFGGPSVPSDEEIPF